MSRRARVVAGSGSLCGWAFLALAALLLPLPARGSVDGALSQGRAWLIAQQNADGSFGPGAELLPRDSAAAVLALTGGPADPAIGLGAEYLTALPESAAYYRALRVQALARAGSSFTALIATLDEFRNGEGIGAFGTYYSNLFDTTQAIEAYAEEESAHQLDIVPLIDYLRTSQAADGGWGYLPNNPSQVYYTGEALWALSRLRTLAVPAQVITAARGFLLAKLQGDGTFGSVLETAVAYRALVGSGYQFTATQPDVVGTLLAAQRLDGSWEGDPYTTAEAVRALSVYRPNLVVTALAASPPTATAGSTVQVSVTVQNVGPQAAVASRLELRAGSATSDDPRGEAAVPALAAGAVFSATLPVSTAGVQGELLLFAVADADGAVAEESELDNVRSVRIALTALPDLAVFTANFSLSVPRPQPLQAFSIRATIQNLGEQPVTSFGYRLTRVVAGVPVQTFPTGNLGPLAPGASLLLTVPNVSLPEGEHTVRLELDPAGAITEVSEEDNVAEYTFFVVDDTLADLSLADADFATTPADAVPGQAVSITLIVRNKGNQSGGAVVDFFDGESTTGTPVLTKSANVGANGTATLTGSFTPQGSSVVLTAVVDRAGTVAESDENNNRARRYLRALPDLAVGYDGVTLVPERPLAGDTTTVRINVRNAGSLTSTPADVALFAGLPEAGGIEVGRTTVAAIAAAGNANVEVPWTAAGGATDLVVVVDPDDAILERSEANNRTVRRVTVQRASGPNLVVEAVDLAQATHSALDLGLTGTIGLTVANQGTAPTDGAYLVRLFEDRDGDRRFAAPDRDLASTVLDQPLAAGATTPVTFAIDTTLAFARSLVLAEVDALDTIAETREDDNQRTLFGDCEAATPAASFVPVEKWHLPDVDVQSTPAVVQLSDDNGDGAIDSRDNPDVVVHASDAQGRLVLAVSGLDGSRLWAFRSTAANPLQSDKANVSAADLDGDGVAEVLAVQTDNRLLALDHRGLVHWRSEPIEGTGGDWRGGSAVGDLTGDGVPEIVVGRAVLSNTGKRLAVGTANAARNHNYYGPFGTPFLYDQQHAIIADLDLDGRNEIVAGDTAYRLVDGVLTVVWDWVEHDNMLKDGFAAVGNLDTDDFPEIVYVSAGFVKVIQHDGAAQRGRYARIVPIQPPIGPDSMITFWGGPPTIADLTGDGVPEILVAGDTALVAFTASLDVLWRKPTFDFAAMTSATAFDLDGDGQREVIYNDENSLFILDGRTGEVRHERMNTSLTGTELPVVADLDNDGVADILVGSNRHRSGDGSTRGLHALGHAGWRGTRAIWNQHSYHVTNVQLDGTVPAHEVPSWQLNNTFRANLELPRPQQRLQPNLTIGLPRLGAVSAQGIPVTLRIGNGGAAPVGAGVEVTLAAASGGPAVGSARTLTALAPGEWEDVTVYWQAALTEPVAAVAVVDPSEEVAECDRTDNSLDFTVEERLLPDLAIPAPGGITVTGSTTAGQLIDLAVLVKNHGPAASPATVVRVSDGTVALGEAAAGTLAPGVTTTVTVRVDTLLLAAGLHSFHAAVDPDDLVLEVDEDNNGGLVQLTLAAANKPDLAATTLTVEPPAVAAGATSTLQVEVLNRGTALTGGFQVSFRVNGVEVSRVTYPGQLDNAGRATVSYELSTLGRQGTLQITAMADPASLVSEVSEANNTATASLVVTPSPVSLAVSSDKSRYKPAETAQVTVAVTNAGTQPFAGSLRVVLQDALGAEVGTIGERPVTLPTGGSVQAFSWPAANALPGPYFAVATFYSDGVAVAVGQTSFSVIADISLQAQIAGNQATYRPSSTVFLTGGVRNLATSTLVAGAVADLSILDPGGQPVFQQTSALGQVLPGAFLPVAGTWPVGTAAPGLYRVELRVLSSTNELLALGTSAFRVESTGDTGAGVRGSLTVVPTMQGVGGSLAVEYSLENRGNAAAPGLVAHLEMLALATGEPVRTLDVPTPLLAGASAAGRWRIQTTGLPPSQYLVSLAAVVDGAMSPLGSELVTLLPGLLVDDLSLREGDSGTHTAQVTVRLQPANDAPVTVELATADGSAIGGEDYDAASGTLTFAPGETSKSIAIEVHGDTTEELHETLLVNLVDANGAWIADGQAVVTIEDEEGCASTDLLSNGGGEEVTLDGTFAGWTGTGWEGGYASPQPFAGEGYFLARGGSALELTQDVSLAPFASRIDAGGQAFVFEGFVAAESPAARVVVDYRDALGQVLDSFDSGPLGNGTGWQAVVDRRVAPAGTREARVRLLGSGVAAAAFDRLAVRSLGVVTLFAADESVAESEPHARVTLALSCGAGAPVAVAYQTADLEAKAGEDYDAKNGTASFAAGELSATVDVTLGQDVLDEEDERFQLALTSNDVVVLTNAATVTVLDDDGAVTLHAEPAAVSEGDTGTVDAVFALTLSSPSGREVSVSYGTAPESAAAGSDFVAASGTVTFAPGTTEREVRVAVKGDLVDELAETFRLTLSSPQNVTLADDSATGTIVDDDTASLAAIDTEVVEGDVGIVTAQVPVRLSVPSDRAVQVAYTTVAGTAASPADFSAVSGTLTFPPGSTQQTIAVPIAGETLEEVTETFLVRLSEAQNADLGDPEATVTIVDEDGPVFSIADVSIVEGNSGTRQAVFTVSSLKSPADVVWVDDDVPTGALPTNDSDGWNWVTANPPPFSGSRSHQSALLSSTHQHLFTNASNTLTVNPGDFLIAYVFLDPANPPGEVMLQWNDGTWEHRAYWGANQIPFGANGTNSRRFMGPLPAAGKWVRLEVPASLVGLEGRTLNGLAFTLFGGRATWDHAGKGLHYDAASTRTVTMDVTTVDGSASAGADYVPVATTLTFAPGEVAKTVVVDVVGEKVEEPDETFLVRLEHPTNAALQRPEAVGTILDDDVFIVAAADLYLVESKPSAPLKLTLNRASEDPIGVRITTVDDVALQTQDYTSTAQTVTFPPGTTVLTVPIPLHDDTTHEGPERFWVDLSEVTNAHLARTRVGVHLLDDEKPASYELAATIRDFKSPHPDIHSCSSVPRPAELLAADGRPAYLSGGTGAANFAQWYHDTPGVNLAAGYDMSFTKGATSYSFPQGSNFFPIDGKLYGNDSGGHNYWMTAEVHAWFTYEPGATITVTTDDDGWCYVNNRLAINLFACHAAANGTATLNTIAATHGLVQGESYRLDCFQAERGPGQSGFGFSTPLYLQQFDPGVLQIAPQAMTLAEGATAPLVVERVGGGFGTVSATAASTGGTATPNVDFTAVDVPIVRTNGQKQAVPLPVVTANDSALEGEETVRVDLVQPSPPNVVGVFGSSTLKIVDDESFPVPALLTPVVSEGSLEDVLMLPVVLQGQNVYGVTLGYSTANGTAIANSDYQATSGTLTFPVGVTRQLLAVRTFGDTTVEPDESFDVVFSGGGILGGSARLTVTLANDDGCATPNLVKNPSFDQAHSTPTTVPGWTTVVGDWTYWPQGSYDGGGYAYAGNSPFGELYQDVDVSAFASFIDQGAQRFAFRIALWSGFNDDKTQVILEFRDEAKQLLSSFDFFEWLEISDWGILSTAKNAPAGTRWVRIRATAVVYSGAQNNAHFDGVTLRALGVPTLAPVDRSVNEGQAGPTSSPLTVSLTCPTTTAVTAEWVTLDGTARAGEDYQAALGTVTIPAGTTSAGIPLTVLGDTVSEGSETFRVRLQAPTGAVIFKPEGIVTITDDETKLTIGSKSKSEGNAGSSLLTLDVTLDNAITLPVTVDYTTEDYAALAGEDYVATSGTLTFAPGEKTKTVSVEVLGDTEVEPDEDFFVVLSNPNNAAIAQARGAATIKQDDIEITVAEARVAEGNSGQRDAVFEVRLSSPSTQTVSVTYQTADGLATAGADYVARSSTTLNFPAGTALLTVKVVVLGDTVAEGSETFLLRLSQPVNANLGQTEATGFIIDDDDCPSVNLVLNPGAELVTTGEINSWREVASTTWGVRTVGPAPAEGTAYFVAGSDATAELAQDVDVSAFATWIDDGVQRFSFEGFVRSAGSPLDVARVIVEYRDAANANELARYDSGGIADNTAWRYVSDLTTVPMGTRWIRVRLIGVRQRPSGNNNAYFDGLSLRSLGTPILLLPDREVAEGDESSVTLPYDFRLTCAGERPISLAYTTLDGTAKAGVDYAAGSGTLSYDSTAAVKTVPIETFGDFLSEIRETFRLQVHDVVNAVVLDAEATITLADADMGRPVPGQTRVYTLDGDFDLGFAAGVNHDAPGGDQLQLDAQGGTFPFLWVAASGRGTIVKIDTRSGKVLGEFSTNPDDRGNSNPSRTTVAFDGSVWVGNRDDGSVTHLGLAELGQCVDRNDNGAIETSSGYANVLPWSNAQGANTNGGVSTAADECILHYVKIRNGNFLPRHVSVDREGRIWVGAYGTCTSCFDQLDGTTGAVLRQVNLPCGGYGGLIDGNGVLWSSTNGNLLRWDPATAVSTAQCLAVPGAYGVAIGRDGHIYVNNHGGDQITKVAPNGTTLLSFKRGSTCGQGLAVDDDEHIWSSSSRWCDGTQISHVKGDGTSVGTLDNVPSGTTGISVDDTGKIWAVADQGNKAFRIDPDQGPLGADGVSHVGAIDLVVAIPNAFAYNYSDMTGFQALRHTLRQGSWSTTQDAGFAGAEWGVISWNGEPQASVPAGSSIVVEVRTAETVVGLSTQSWLAITNGQPFQRFGRYLQVRVTLRKGSATTGPVLSDLRIGIQEPDVRVADATVTEGDAGDVSATFAVTLSEAVGHPVVIGYRTVADSAAAGTDYRTSTGTLTIPVGSLAGSITVPVIGDTEDEDDETFTVELTSAQGGRIVDGIGEGRIVDDDTRLVVSALKTAELADDRDANGVVTPGDVLGYTVVVRNIGAAALTGLMFEDTAPAGTQIVAGSATADAGTVESESPVRVAIPSLAVDATVTVRFRVTIGVPWGSDPAVVNQGRVTGLPNGPVLTDDPVPPGADDPTVTPLAAVPVLAASKRDELATDADADGRASPGDTVSYEVVVTNTGITDATEVVLVDAVPPHTALVGSPETSQGSVTGTSPVRVELGTLAANASATVTFGVRIDSPLPTGVDEIVNQATVNSVELPAAFSGDPDAPGHQDPTVTTVTAAPRLLFTKVDELAIDADLDTRPSPGDTIAYTVRLRNDGNTAATAVVIHDATPPNTTLVAGSVSLSAGTLSGVDPIVAQVGELAVGAETVLTFRVRIVSPVEPWVREVVNQATVSCAELDDLKSDDPDVPGVANPTATAVAAAPVLMLSKTDALHTDPNGDSYASPGEVVLYQLTLTNTGNTAATAVALTDPLPHFATLEAGSLQTSLGTATEGDPLQVAIDTLPVGGTATVSFRVRIADPFPASETELVNHASVAAAELAAVASDDPATAEPRDATRTPVIALVEASVGDLSVAENAGTASFTVTLSAASQVPVTVGYSVGAGSATAGADFTIVADTLTIPVGQTQGTVAVPVLDDTLDEPDETFTLTLASPVGAVLAGGQATATIVDDDAPPSLDVADLSVGEGDGGTTAATFTLTLSAPSALAVSVDYATATGTAGAADFTAAGGTATFAPGETARTVTVDVLGDGLDEADENFALLLSAPQQVVLARNAASATIVDDDAPPAISIGDVAVDEGNSGTVEARFTVTLSAPSGREVQVHYSSADLEAVAGADYQAAAGDLVLPAGTTSAAVAVPVLGDLADEADERFELRLSQPVSATVDDGIGIGTIRDDDAPPTLSVGDVSVHEGDSGFVTIDVPLRLSAASGFVVTVAYSTADGTATSPADYLSAADAAMIPAGATEHMVTLQVRGDTVDELDETLELRLSNAVNATLADAAGQVTIVDDDAPTQASIGDVTVTEGHSGTQPATFTVTLSQPSPQQTKVSYVTAAVSAAAEADFVATSGELVFATGESAKSVVVQLQGDLLLEPDETFEVRLSQPLGLDLGDAAGLGTIVDDETCPSPNLLANPGAELATAVGTVPGWTAVTGTQWQTRGSDPLPAEGNAYFYAGSTDYAELAQDVDVSAYAARIAAGGQLFAFEGRVRTRDESPSDAARIVVEYRDAANAVVLGAYDSGDLVSPTEWRAVTDIRTAPVGTARIRVRLLATRFAGTPDDGYFDALVLRSLRAPVLTIDDVAVDEGDAGTTNANFTVRLSCPLPSDVSVGYRTADGTANAAADYTALAPATLTLPAGSVTATIAVPVIGDVVPEPDETFQVQLSDAVGAVLLDPLGIGTIRENVSCPAASTIDYKGYTAASCAVPQNAVTVHDQAGLDAYLANFGWDGTKVRNVIVNFNPAGQVVIVSPCEIRMKGTGTGGYLDVNAEKVCLYGRKGVVVAEDHGNPDQGIVASAITLVSEEGNAGFSKGLELAADTVDVRALKEAKVGLSCQVTANVLNVVSTGDLTTSEALVRQDSTVHAGSVVVQASRGATIGPATTIDVAGSLVVRSTGNVVGSVAKVSQSAHVTAATMDLTSGNKVTVEQLSIIDVDGLLNANAAGSCSIAASAVINAGSTAGSCLP